MKGGNSMDQKKIGSFLKELRKEKDITQEQLAEKIKVSGRTVSRWETGSNMPDISLLAQLADFYDVSIPEIIDGERKSENMNEEVKETVLKLSDYTETINQKIKGRLFVLTIIAIIGMIAFVIIEFTGLDTPGSVYERVAGAGLGLDCTSQQKVDITLYFYTSFNEHNTPYTVLESDNSESMPDVLH